MSITAFLFKFVQFANLTIRSIHAVLQLLQFGVLIATLLFRTLGRPAPGRYA